MVNVYWNDPHKIVNVDFVVIALYQKSFIISGRAPVSSAQGRGDFFPGWDQCQFCPILGRFLKKSIDLWVDGTIIYLILTLNLHFQNN